MKLEDIQKQWKEDAYINDSNLDREALKIPLLHSKYYDIMLVEKKTYQALKSGLSEIEHILTQFYEKTLTAEEMDFYGFEYPDKKILRQDVPRVIAVHPEVIKINTRIALQSDKIEFLKSILQTINSRSFHIRDAIEWKKFTAGEH